MKTTDLAKLLEAFGVPCDNPENPRKVWSAWEQFFPSITIRGVPIMERLSIDFPGREKEFKRNFENRLVRKFVIETQEKE